MAAPRPPTLVWALIGLDGRVNREVFWLGTFGCSFLTIVLTMPTLDPATGALHMAPLSPFLLAALFWTQVALSVKRLHDRGLTGWFALVCVIPFAGIVAFLVIGLMPGDAGANAFAPATNMRGPV
ncbi:MAG: DUF805 domain-containing protein [Pseudomonadota bacterium]